MSEKEKLIKQNKELTIEYYTPVIPDKVLYNTNIALDDLRDYNMISSDMGQNATWRKEFLLGQRNIDTEWDAYISFMERPASTVISRSGRTAITPIWPG